MQDLKCKLFCCHIGYVMSGYGFARIKRQTAHMYFCLNKALIACFFTLNFKNIVYMNKQIKQFGQQNIISATKKSGLVSKSGDVCHAHETRPGLLTR